MQGQDVISRPGRRPVTHKGKYLLNPKKDLPLLQLIRDATFISRQQIELLIAGRTEEVNYRCRNRRLERLVELNQIQIYPQCFPYPGRIFAITQAGINTLQVTGMGILSVSADTETLADVGQVPHFIGLNQIEIAARKAFGVRRWIAEIASPSDSNAIIYLGIEYERTIKSKDRYAQIRKKLEAERQIQGLLYFADTETNASLLSREVYSATVPVGVVIASQFQTNGVDAMLRVVQDRSVIRVSVQDYIASIGRLKLL